MHTVTGQPRENRRRNLSTSRPIPVTFYVCTHRFSPCACEFDSLVRALPTEKSISVRRGTHSSWSGLSRLSTSFLLLRCQDVDARDKPGHDEFRLRYRFLGLSR